MAADAAGAVAAALRALAPRTARVVVTFATGCEPGAVARDARAAAGGARVVGCEAAGVLTGEGEREGEPAVAALALGGDAACEPFAATEARPPAVPATEPGLALVFADAYTRPPAELLRDLAPWSVAGGVATGAEGIYPAHRWLDGEVITGGVAGLLIAERAIVAVAQACLPVGPEHVVTSASGRVIAELDGRRAFDVFAERGRPLLGDLPRAAQTIFVATPEGLRGLMRFDPERGLLATSEAIEEGTRIRFAVREPVAAREELRRAVGGVAAQLDGRPPRFGFYFDCAGRGRGLFGVADHDVAFIQSTLGRFPMVGFAGGGELAGGRAHLFTGVLAVVP